MRWFCFIITFCVISVNALCEPLKTYCSLLLVILYFSLPFTPKIILFNVLSFSDVCIGLFHSQVSLKSYDYIRITYILIYLSFSCIGQWRMLRKFNIYVFVFNLYLFLSSANSLYQFDLFMGWYKTIILTDSEGLIPWCFQ